MTAVKLGDQEIEFDREATAAAYRQVDSGDAKRCGCTGCRNFIAQRDRAFPEQFLKLLDQLGIDWRKEGEVYECGPDATGRHIYGGWFYFVGRMVQAGERLLETAKFKYYIGTSFPTPPRAFAGHPVLTVEFETTLPWVIE